MEPIRVDFTGVEPAKFEALPPGVYKAKVTGWEYREAGEKAKTPGATYVHWEFTVQEGSETSRKFWNNSHFGKDSLPYTLTFLTATGRAIPTAGQPFDPDVYVGADVLAKLKVVDDQNNVVWFKNVNEVVGAGQGSLLP